METYVRSLFTGIFIAIIQPLSTLPASAGSPCAHVGPTRDVICVCSPSYCWLEPGTRHRFAARFDKARALSDTGAIELGRPFKRRRPIVPALSLSVESDPDPLGLTEPVARSCVTQRRAARRYQPRPTHKGLQSEFAHVYRAQLQATTA